MPAHTVIVPHRVWAVSTRLGTFYFEKTNTRNSLCDLCGMPMAAGEGVSWDKIVRAYGSNPKPYACLDCSKKSILTDHFECGYAFNQVGSLICSTFRPSNLILGERVDPQQVVDGITEIGAS